MKIAENCKLIVALDKGDRNEIVQVMVDDHQLKTKYMDPYVIYKLAEVGWNRDDGNYRRKKYTTVFGIFRERDPVVDNNDELIMASRMRNAESNVDGPEVSNRAGSNMVAFREGANWIKPE